MKKKTTPWILAALGCIAMLSGCQGEKQKIYEQAEQNLEQGSYEAALSGYETSAANGVHLPQSYRGMGIASLRMGDYEGAIESFTNALNCEKVSKSLAQDILSYRITAEIRAQQYENAMADCQTLARDYSMDADGYYLAGTVALAMDSYDEAMTNFDEAYVEEPTYDMALQIYQAYLERDMEADGTRYLEAALETEPKDAEDYCDRGRAYYYMQDYSNAQKELIEAVNNDSTEALLILGMVYLASDDISNARAMYQEYTAAEGESAGGYNGLALCDIAEENYDAALANISTGLPLASEEERQDLLFNEIVAYERKLDFSKAQEKAEEYLEVYPDDESVQKELAFLKTRTSTQENTAAESEVSSQDGAALDNTDTEGTVQ